MTTKIWPYMVVGLSVAFVATTGEAQQFRRQQGPSVQQPMHLSRTFRPHSTTVRWQPPAAPRLGFYGHFSPGFGMVVDGVVVGQRAHQLGLETGDVILAICGRRITSEQGYLQAMQFAGEDGNLTIRDVRTGRTVLVAMNPSQNGTTPDDVDNNSDPDGLEGNSEEDVPDEDGRDSAEELDESGAIPDAVDVTESVTPSASQAAVPYSSHRILGGRVPRAPRTLDVPLATPGIR